MMQLHLQRYLFALVSCILFPVLVSQGGEIAAKSNAKFIPINIIIDSSNTPMAAYQVQVTYDAAKITIVGVEGGDPQGFAQEPFFDQGGMQGGRIIIAAFVARDDLATTGKVRVARLHLRVIGDSHDPASLASIRVMTAARPGGKKTYPKADLVSGAN